MTNIIYDIHNIEYFINKKSELILKSFLSIDSNILNNNIRIKLIFNNLKKLKIPIYIVNKKFINKLIGKNINKRICIIIKKINESYIIKIRKFIEEVKNKNSIFLILENIVDSRNLGACIRNADAAGIKTVLITKTNTSPINEIVNISSSGSLNNINIIKFNDIRYILKIFKKYNTKIVSTSDKCNNILYNNNLKPPIVYIFGSEYKGITNVVKKYSDLIIKIPMYGYVNSLNVSVSVGICLFESVRQKNF